MATIDLVKNSSFETKFTSLVETVNGIKPSDGFSPSVVAMKAGNKTTITITHKDGNPATTDILDGELINYGSSEPDTVEDGDTWVSDVK